MIKKLHFLCFILIIVSFSFTQNDARFQFNFVDENENPIKPVHVGAREFKVTYTVSCKECAHYKGNLGCSTMNEYTSYASCGYYHQHSDKLILKITGVFVDGSRVSPRYKLTSQEGSYYKYNIIIR